MQTQKPSSDGKGKSSSAFAMVMLAPGYEHGVPPREGADF